MVILDLVYFLVNSLVSLSGVVLYEAHENFRLDYGQ